jgi:uncharacterized membrane protein
MSHNDFKLYFFNAVAMALSFSNIENVLKIILLIASIFYTILKTVETLKKKKDGENND